MARLPLTSRAAALLSVVVREPVRRWQARLRERRTERLTARAATLSEDDAHDLLVLQSMGIVRARATGQSITRIYAELENRIARPLRIVIRPGTYFVARGNYQNMVTRRTYTVNVRPRSTENVAVDAACINAGRPIPGGDARFRQVRRVGDDLARFLEAAQGADQMTVQAGVWALTDHYSAAQIQARLLLRDQLGNSRRAVSDQNIREARRLLDSLGIRHQL